MTHWQGIRRSGIAHSQRHTHTDTYTCTHKHTHAPLQLSLAIAFAALLSLELARATRTPLLPASLHAGLHAFMSHFVDARDLGGPLFVTHMALLLGCACPLWWVVMCAVCCTKE